MKLWVGKDTEDGDLWVVDKDDSTRLVGGQVWIFRVSLNTWILVNRDKYRALLRPVSQKDEYEYACRMYKRKYSEIHNPNHQFGDGVSGVGDMRWAGGGSGDAANVRRKFE